MQTWTHSGWWARQSLWKSSTGHNPRGRRLPVCRSGICPFRDLSIFTMNPRISYETSQGVLHPASVKQSRISICLIYNHPQVCPGPFIFPLWAPFQSHTCTFTNLWNQRSFLEGPILYQSDKQTLATQLPFIIILIYHHSFTFAF